MRHTATRKRRQGARAPGTTPLPARPPPARALTRWLTPPALPARFRLMPLAGTSGAASAAALVLAGVLKLLYGSRLGFGFGLGPG